MAKYETVRVGRRKLAEARVHGVYAAAWRFDKHRVYTERDGSTSEVPFSETVYLLRMPGEDRKLWLTPQERQRVIEALQEVDPIGSPLTEASPQMEVASATSGVAPRGVAA